MHTWSQTFVHAIYLHVNICILIVTELTHSRPHTLHITNSALQIPITKLGNIRYQLATITLNSRCFSP